VNLWWEIQRAWAIIKRREVPEKGSTDTDFRDLKGTAVIRDGVVRNEMLQAGLPFLAVAGQGTVNLVESALNYKLDATVVRPAEGEADGTATELAGVSIPLSLSGSLDAPKVDVSLADIAKQRAGQAVLEKLGVEGEAGKSAEDSAKEAAKKKAEEKVRDKFKDVFGD
jgi:AsmA protein